MNSTLRTFSMILFLGLFTWQAEAQVVKTVGATGADFTSLRQAMAAINANTDGAYVGAIELQIIDNTIEPSDGVISPDLVGINVSTVWTSLKIYPTVSGKTISGDFSGALISLNGANNVTIDGRRNQIGTTRALTIINTGGTNPAIASTITMKMDACNNTVKYCTIKGSSTNLYGGTITLGSTSAIGGNNNNTISNNLITNVSNTLRPTYSVYSAGSLNGAPNKLNTISNNDFADFFIPATDPTQLNMAIRLDKMNASFTITGNSFYETTPFVGIEDASYEIVHIQSGGNHTISGNYFGGSATKCGGTAWTKTEANNNFRALVMNIDASPVSNVLNNTVKNINWTNTGTAMFHAFNIQGGVNIKGNIIGDFNTPGSITFNGGDGSQFYSIQLINTGVDTISNNKIGSIVAGGLDPASGMTFYGIFNQSSGTTTISGNTIGNPAVANNIFVGGSGANSFVYGFRGLGAGISTYTGNTVNNLTNNGKAYIVGMRIQNGTNTLSGNFINKLSYTTNSVSAGNNMVGIDFIASGGTTNVSNNIISLGGNNISTIYGISVENTTAASNSNFYFNTVNISGIDPSSTGKSFCLSSKDPLNLNRNFRNNIFTSTRSSSVVGATGLHYGIFLNFGAGTLNCNYNDYSVSGNASVLGNYAAIDISTLPIVTEQIGNDVNSLAINPGFANALGTSDVDYKTTATLPGVGGTGILVDYLGLARGATPHMGAFEALYSGLTDHQMDFPYHLIHTSTGIHAIFEGDVVIELYTISGQLIDKLKARDSYSHSLDKGVFIIRINGKASKFLM